MPLGALRAFGLAGSPNSEAGVIPATVCPAEQVAGRWSARSQRKQMEWGRLAWEESKWWSTSEAITVRATELRVLRS